MQRDYDRDHNCNRKSFNSSERWAAKRDILTELKLYKSTDIQKMKEDIEVQNAIDCYHSECEATRLQKPYNCNCPDVMSWTDDEVLEYLNLV